MSTAPIRWGILGTANIARKNWQAIHLSGNGVVAAVASRERSRAERFLAECQSSAPVPVLPQAMGSYAELVESPEVDAVYVPLPTGLRRDWVIRAARAGKHVVCEKPCAPSLADLEAMTAACTENGVQFMDGVMFVHTGRMERIRALVAEKSTLGGIRRVTTQFSFNGDAHFFSENMRLHSAMEPQGCLGDLGWYSITFALEAFEGRMPRSVSGRILSSFHHPGSPEPVPTEFSAELTYDGGVTSSFYNAFITENQQWAHVSGTHGSLTVRDFVLPFVGCETEFEVDRPEFHLHGCRFDMESHARRIAVSEHGNNHPTAQETRLFRHFAAQVNAGSLNPEWPLRALKTQKILDACLASARDSGRPVLLEG